ncbi:MAG: cupin domain-containing protein [Halopenitus sp.]
MGFTKTNYGDVDDKHGLHFLREPLACQQLGFSVIDVEDGREGPIHDHAGDGQEEVYLLLEGAATLTVADEPVELDPGDAVRVDPETSRQLVLHGDSLLVAAGAP